MNKNYRFLYAIVAIALIVAGFAYLHQEQIAQDGTDTLAVRATVTQFGSIMQKVSLAAPDTLNQIASTYAPYASSSIIDKWKSQPSFAPGHGLSSLWPSGIEIKSIVKNSNGTYTVQGTVDEVAHATATGGVPPTAVSGIAAQFPVTITLVKYHNIWLVSDYQAGAETTIAKTSTTTQ